MFGGERASVSSLLLYVASCIYPGSMRSAYSKRENAEFTFLDHLGYEDFGNTTNQRES